jgi:hypothetical protein
MINAGFDRCDEHVKCVWVGLLGEKDVRNSRMLEGVLRWSLHTG